MTKIETTAGIFNVTEDYQTVKSEIYRGNAFVELNKINTSTQETIKIFINRSHIVHIGKILAKGGINSTTDELCRNVDKSANAHSNYRQPAFCQYIVS